MKQNKEMVNILEDDKFCDFAFKHGVMKDFWDWCYEFHPEVHAEFVGILNKHDKVLKIVKEKIAKTNEEAKHFYDTPTDVGEKTKGGLD